MYVVNLQIHIPLIQIIMDEKNLEMPSSPQSALDVFLELLVSIEDI